jgi:hypothetical protein
LGKHINELRRKANDKQLASRAKSLVKKWRELLMPTSVSGSATPVQAANSQRSQTVAAAAAQRLQQHQQHQQQQPRLKLTLRMKRSTSNGSGGDAIVEDLPNYEVFRMEGVGSTNVNTVNTNNTHELETDGNNTSTKPAWRIRKRTRKRDISSCSSTSSGGSSGGNGLKRLKLRLGDETMSTIDLDSSNMT